jgi:hypothetical protein
MFLKKDAFYRNATPEWRVFPEADLFLKHRSVRAAAFPAEEQHVAVHNTKAAVLVFRPARL